LGQKELGARDTLAVGYEHFAALVKEDCQLETHCTSKPSSIPDYVPFLSAVGVPDASAGSGFEVTAGPMPGMRVGLFMYTTLGAAATPTLSVYGHFIIEPSEIFRFLPVLSTGGSQGACDGQLTLDFNTYYASQSQNPALVAGSTVDLQVWYRDPPAPGGANLTEAGHFVMCP
jgi:hypothetical protein